MNKYNLKTLIREVVSEVINEEYHRFHKDYRLYEGDRHITAIFDDGSRLQFEIHFRDNHREDKEKWRKQAVSKWRTLANEIHRDVQLNEVGNPLQRTWKESFSLALKSPEMKEFILTNKHQQVFPQ